MFTHLDVPDGERTMRVSYAAKSRYYSDEPRGEMRIDGGHMDGTGGRTFALSGELADAFWDLLQRSALADRTTILRAMYNHYITGGTHAD